jgi:uncharacterized protein with HEPN domain
VRDPRERLEDILEAIRHIQRHTTKGRTAFDQDELVQNWCVRHLQIIGEAARALPDETRDKIPEVPWSNIIGMRHILVHNYFGIDSELVWNVVDSQLNPLKTAIELFLKDPQNESPR